MRKALGVFFVASLMASMAVVGAGQAGAAAKLPTCKAFNAKQTTNPPLPILSKKNKVNATVKTTGKLTGCTGGGVASATTSSTYKYNGNCLTLFTGKGGKTTPAKPLTVFTWSNHKTSSATTTTKTLTAPGVVPAKVKLVTKIVTGQFKGATSTGTILVSAPKGACVSVPGKSSTITGGKATFK